MTCSTYKSFGGPPGGLVLTNDPDIAAAVERAAYPGMTANYDASRLASLCVACAEVIEFWPSYADACLTNAGHLAKALGAEGFDVVARDLGATESHHVALDVGSLGGGRTVAGTLEAARILTSAIGLPGDGLEGSPGGLRTGVQEVTRFGLGPAEMEQAARWMAAALLHGGSAQHIAGEVARLRQDFATVGYCFPPSGG